MKRPTRRLLLAFSVVCLCALIAYFVLPAGQHVVSPSRGEPANAREDVQPAQPQSEPEDLRRVVEASESHEDSDRVIAEPIEKDVWDFTPGGEDGAFDDMHQPGPLYEPAEFPVMSRGMTGLDPSEIDRETAIDLAIRRFAFTPVQAGLSVRSTYDRFSLEAIGFEALAGDDRNAQLKIVERYAQESQPLLESLQILVRDVTASLVEARDFVVFEHGTTLPPVRTLGPIAQPGYCRIGNWYVDISFDYSGHAAIASIVEELVRMREAMKLELKVLAD